MKTAVISGGSSGIGKETARLLGENGYKVYELSRSGSDTDNVTHITCDLTKDEDVESAVKRICAECDSIDLLINNAGYGISGAVEFTQTENAKGLFDVNFFGTARLTKALIPMLRCSRGRIINVSSVGGIFGLPFQAFYSASKYALNGYSLALASELKRFGVSVCSVMPGDSSTGFTKSRIKDEAGELIYGDSIKKSVSMMEKDETHGMSAESVAKAICKIAGRKKIKPTYIIGFKYKIFAFLSKVLPIRLVNYIVGRLYAK